MKITTLIENSRGERPLHAEHGLSFYIETGQHNLLMDTGASPVAWENADILGKDLDAVDTVVISHGHFDHAGGVMSFAARNGHAALYMQKRACGDFNNPERYIGIDREILKLPNLHLLEGEHRIDEELTIFSGIKGRRLWPSGNNTLRERRDGVLVQDRFEHEQCLVITENGKRVLLSGCAHNGILNVLDRFGALYGGVPDVVLSGFHMKKNTPYTPEDVRGIEETAAELKALPTLFYTGHCTGPEAFAILKSIMGEQLRPLHSGDEFELP